MIDILNLEKSKFEKLYKRVIDFKKIGWNNSNIAFHCDINCDHVQTILNFAVRNKDLTTKQIRRPKGKQIEFLKVTNLSSYNKETPFTHLFTDPNKIIEVIEVTPNFHVSKDFAWFFK